MKNQNAINNKKICIGALEDGKKVNLTMKEMYLNMLITGMKGAGKTQGILYNVIEQLIDAQSALFIIDYKNEYINFVEKLAEQKNISDKVIVISLDRFETKNKIDLFSNKMTSFETAALWADCADSLNVFSTKEGGFWKESFETIIKTSIEIEKINNGEYRIIDVLDNITNKDIFEDKFLTAQNKVKYLLKFISALFDSFENKDWIEIDVSKEKIEDLYSLEELQKKLRVNFLNKTALKKYALNETVLEFKDFAKEIAAIKADAENAAELFSEALATLRLTTQRKKLENLKEFIIDRYSNKDYIEYFLNFLQTIINNQCEMNQLEIGAGKNRLATNIEDFLDNFSVNFLDAVVMTSENICQTISLLKNFRAMINNIRLNEPETPAQVSNAIDELVENINIDGLRGLQKQLRFILETVTIDFRKYKNLPPNTSGCVMGDVNNVFKGFKDFRFNCLFGLDRNDKELRVFTIKELIEDGYILILNIPEMNYGKSITMINLIVKQLFVRELMKRDNYVGRPAFIIADEFDKFAQFTDNSFSDTEFVSLCRSKNCGLIAATQSIEALYAKTFNSALVNNFINNMQAQIILRQNINSKLEGFLNSKNIGSETMSSISKLNEFEGLMVNAYDGVAQLLNFMPNFDRRYLAKKNRKRVLELRKKRKKFESNIMTNIILKSVV